MAQALGKLATSVQVLRKGKRKIGPYEGQKHLASAPNGGGMRNHAFVWETQGDGTLDAPAIKIELTSLFRRFVCQSCHAKDEHKRDIRKVYKCGGKSFKVDGIDRTPQRARQTCV